jgi:hypothetical protein
MKTLCKGCIFAELTNQVQTGCQLNKLAKYQEIGKTFFNIETGYYEIETFCKTVRSEIWAKKQTEDLITAINKESANKFSIIVIANEFQIDKLGATLSSLQKSTFQPFEVVVIATAVTPICPDTRLFVLNKLVDSGLRYQYTELFSDISPVDEAFTKIKGNYYTVLLCGDEVEPDLFNRANDVINDVKNQYLWLDSKFPIISTFLHRILDGNKEEALKSKLDSIPHFKAKHFLNEADFNNYN